MKIRKSKRFIYEHNPLVEVSAQVSFDRILNLESDGPKELQSALAALGYTQLNIVRSASIQIAFGPGSPLPQASPAALPTIYHFSSADGERKFSICSDFAAFSCSTYKEWGSFKAQLYEGLGVFASQYNFANMKRVGLRYKDLIQRESLGLAEYPWSKLLAPVVAGIFSTSGFSDSGEIEESAIEQQASQVVMRLDTCKLLLQSALLRSTEGLGLQAFLIDADFFNELVGVPLNVGEISTMFDVLHDSADDLFGHCIEEPLHAALRPTEA